MFREGRVIVPGGGWLEWTVESGKKQFWYTSRAQVISVLLSPAGKG
jgi:putative SOS response-associated peptidase YedK